METFNVLTDISQQTQTRDKDWKLFCCATQVSGLINWNEIILLLIFIWLFIPAITQQSEKQSHKHTEELHEMEKSG